MEFIDLQRQYRELEKEINEGIKNVLEHGKYIMGPEVQQLEKELCDYPVDIALKNILLFVTSGGYMVKGTRVFHPQRPSHAYISLITVL